MELRPRLRSPSTVSGSTPWSTRYFLPTSVLNSRNSVSVARSLTATTSSELVTL
jgi:hypothetical protein